MTLQEDADYFIKAARNSTPQALITDNNNNVNNIFANLLKLFSKVKARIRKHDEMLK